VLLVRDEGRAHIVDLNYFERHLEANIAVSLQSPGGLLAIQISPTENNRHSVRASMKQRFSFFRATVNSPWVMNLFVEQLMGK